MTETIVLIGAGSLQFGFDTMGDKHFGISFDQCVISAQTLFLHALFNCEIKISGHEHPHDDWWYDLPAFMERHDGEMSLYWNN